MQSNSAKTLLLSLLCAAMTCAASIEPGFSSTPSSEGASEALDGPLERAMVGLKDGLKSLSKSLGDPTKNEASLATLTEMQKHVMATKDADPQNLEDIEEDKRAAHKLAFRADMMRLLVELAEMEISICEGKNEDAMARIRGELVPLRNSSHEKYQKN